MQRIVMTRSLLTELSRCDRSFVMSLFHKELDNAHLSGKTGVIDNTANDLQQAMLENLSTIRRIADETGGIRRMDCNPYDIFDKVNQTMSMINSGGPCVIADGALEAGWLIAPFALLVVREDGMWEVYHLSTKGFMKGVTKIYQRTLDKALSDAGPLMKVLADGYADRVAAMYVIGVDGRYMTPYPDPETGHIVHDESDALYCLNFDINSGTIADYVSGIDPVGDIERIQSQLSYNPFWIPEAYVGSQCNNPYTCPFKMYCESHMDPDDVYFHMPSNDSKHLREAGIETMTQLLNYSYENPALENIEIPSGNTFTVSEIGLRELREYEYNIQNKGRLEQ